MLMNSFICDFTEYRNYICFEHTTYLFEFSKRFGPAWFTVPWEYCVDVEPGGHLGVLWEMFEEWMEGRYAISKTKKTA